MAGRCLNRKEFKKKRQVRKKAFKVLRERQKTQSLMAPTRQSACNRTSEYQSVEAEQTARQNVTIEQFRVIREMMPTLLTKLSKITDPRNPKKIKHKITLLMTYGILSFIAQMSSRREANQKMTRPAFGESLKHFFPELENLPHLDTLNRLLEGIGEDVIEIESSLCALMRQLIRNKKFHRYLINGHYPIAIDGTQKLVRKDLLSPEWLERRVGVKNDDKGKEQYYVSVLEANLVFTNGMVIPLMSEFLDYGKGDTSNDKQDCETRSFYRLANRLKKQFPRLPIMILIDGLYAQGPVMKFCQRDKHWEYMIVLKDKSLPSVWEEFDALKVLEPNNKYEQKWGTRRQHFQWVNEIDYAFGPNGRNELKVNVVVCEEDWEDLDDNNEIEIKTSRHAWLSSSPLTRRNVHECCNLGARHRWGIESAILLEKRHGYHYQHCYSYNWDAMRGFHYLMRIAHALNVLAQYTSVLFKVVRMMGLRGFIEFVVGTLAGRWLDAKEVQLRLQSPFQLRLE